MTGSIKLTPEQSKAIKEAREARRQSRVERRNDAPRITGGDRRPMVPGYAGILIFMLGMAVGTWTTTRS